MPIAHYRIQRVKLFAASEMSRLLQPWQAGRTYREVSNHFLNVSSHNVSSLYDSTPAYQKVLSVECGGTASSSSAVGMTRGKTSAWGVGAIQQVETESFGDVPLNGALTIHDVGLSADPRRQPLTLPHDAESPSSPWSITFCFLFCTFKSLVIVDHFQRLYKL